MYSLCIEILKLTLPDRRIEKIHYAGKNLHAFDNYRLCECKFSELKFILYDLTTKVI
jgi:hypothetical protein